MKSGKVESRWPTTETVDGDIVWTNVTAGRFKSIDDHVSKLMLAEAAREEEYLRRHAPIFFDQGYRIEELRIVRTSFAVYPERNLLCLMPGWHVHPLILAVRVQWRKVFPYKIPGGGA